MNYNYQDQPSESQSEWAGKKNPDEKKKQYGYKGIIYRLDTIISLLGNRQRKELLDRDAYSVLCSLKDVSTYYLHRAGFDPAGLSPYVRNRQMLKAMTVEEFLMADDTALASNLHRIGIKTIEKSKQLLRRKVYADV